MVLASRHRRAIRPRGSIRDKVDARAGQYGFCVVLIPSRFLSTHPWRGGVITQRRAGAPKQPKILRERYDEFLDRVREQIGQYYILSQTARYQRRTRIYVGSEADVVLLKMIDRELIWKVYRLTDGN